MVFDQSVFSLWLLCKQLQKLPFVSSSFFDRWYFNVNLQQRRLCLMQRPAVCAVIFFLPPPLDCSIGQLLMLLLLLAVSQHPLAFFFFLRFCTDRIIRVCNKLLVRCTHDLLRSLYRIVQCQPVAEVENRSPAMVIPIHFRDVSTHDSCSQTDLQNALVPVKQI